VTHLNYTENGYRTTSGSAGVFSRTFPGLAFYSRFLSIVLKASVKAKRGLYSDAAWSRSSLGALAALERSGMRISVSGVGHIANLTTPCVIIGNHMGVMEAVILPGIVQPLRNVTFVIKKSLMAYPVFKHVMRSRNPIVVGRDNPRQDLKAVMDGGRKRLKQGISIIVFPQTTRTLDFDPLRFNTIGVKLAQKAGVPVIPLALLTDAWANGRIVKEFGRIDPAKSVHFAFGQPVWVGGRAAEAHKAVIEFIGNHLRRWNSDRTVECRI
jgi:1-acyl-sn-glycerol-3-phosphate acyltransferase